MTSSFLPLLLPTGWLPALLAGLLAGPPPLQDPAGATAPQAPPTAGTDGGAEAEARALWERLVAASRTAESQTGSPDPIQAFRVVAEALRREGVQTNEFTIDYRYLAPDCIRFVLPSRRETGRFGPRQREYWLRDPKQDDVVVLAGREYTEDRRLVDEMHAIARNFVALSDPGRLRITSLMLLDKAPADLPEALARTTRKLTWLRVATPDFELFRRDAAEDDPAAGTRNYLVDLALMADGLPRFAIVRELPRLGRSIAAPMMIRLDRWKERSGYRIPLQLLVHGLEPERLPLTFTEKPSQEIYVTELDLRPGLGVQDFRPN